VLGYFGGIGIIPVVDFIIDVWNHVPHFFSFKMIMPPEKARFCNYLFFFKLCHIHHFFAADDLYHFIAARNTVIGMLPFAEEIGVIGQPVILLNK
jgi:hypothetical protein